MFYNIDESGIHHGFSGYEIVVVRIAEGAENIENTESEPLFPCFEKRDNLCNIRYAKMRSSPKSYNDPETLSAFSGECLKTNARMAFTMIHIVDLVLSAPSTILTEKKSEGPKYLFNLHEVCATMWQLGLT